MKKLFLIIISLIACACYAPATREELTLDSPIVQNMPAVTPSMQVAGYWIGKTEHPDEIILHMDEINLFNEQTAKKYNIIKISSLDNQMWGNVIKNSINELYQYASDNKFYYSNGKRVTKKHLQNIYEKMNTHSIGDTEYIDFAIITERVSQKILPTDDVYLRKGNGFFDRLQMSSLDIGTPIAVLWKSKDEKWLYVRSSLTVGWIPKEYAAYCPQEDIIKWESPEKFAVGIKYKSAVYLNDERTSYFRWLPLGAKLPLSSYFPNSASIAVDVPVRGADGKLKTVTGYINPSDISDGFVEYTSRNMLNLAFEMQNAPYGWGGQNSEQDCSGFILQLFGAVGVTLPRNSSQQGISGKNIYPSEAYDGISPELALASEGIPGATIIQFPGHIMLYIGSEKSEPYVIHSMWSYEEEIEDIKVQKIPGRVVVSSLNLSKDSENGPYINRITNIRVIKP